MIEIKPLNQSIDINSDEFETIISELMEREEYSSCTGNGCRSDIN